MKILMVAHQFLPRHLAGTEVYTYHLARELRRRGHAVHLFFTEIRSDRSQYEQSRGEFDGIPYLEVVHNHYFPSFEHGYRDREMDAIFESLLGEVQPDIVHLQHLQLHSIDYIEIAKRRALPIVYTLHEYMLLCLRDGLLLRPGLVLCDGPEPEACARCAITPPHGRKPIRLDPRLQGIVRVATRSPSIWQTMRALWRRIAGNHRAEVGASDGYVRAVAQRQAETRQSLEAVDLFLAPSRFLRQRFIDAGMLRAERIEYSPYGFPTEPFADLARKPSDFLRVGFIGTIGEYKGVHLIVEAFQKIEDRSIECRIYGDLQIFPDYTERLASLGTPPQVQFLGRLERPEVPRALAELDLLIVPSLWYENAPLTIQEAFLAGVPVLTADQGGMAELVTDGVNGLLFRLGDADDLREKILRCAREPGLLSTLRRARQNVRTIEEDAALMEDRYEHLLNGRSPRKPAGA